MVTWIGADWDSVKCVVAFVLDGEVVTKPVKRRPDAVRSFFESYGIVDPVVAIESGDQLWADLWRAAGAVVHVFDGKKARRFSESLCSSGARDDKRSAEDLLAMVQSPAHRRDANTQKPKDVRAIERLLRVRDDTCKDAVRCENRLVALLRQVHPAFVDVAPRSIKAHWGLRALELAPTPAHWASLSEEERASALKGSSKAKRPALRKALGALWVERASDENDAVAVHVRVLVRALRDALGRSKASQKALDEAVTAKTTGTMLVAVKGIGSNIAAAMIVGLSGDENDRNRLAVALGAAPVTARSGKRGDARSSVSMRRAAPPAMRRASYQIGWQLAGNHAWAAAQYAHYRARGISAAASYRRITRSFARVVPALIKNNVAFDGERYVHGLKSQGVNWAMHL